MKSSRMAFKYNGEKRNILKTLISIILVAIFVISFGYMVVMYNKIQRTVDVIMWAKTIGKNELITEDMLEKYAMNEFEFEKYAVSIGDNESRRIWTWDERGKIIGSFSALTLKKGTVADVRDTIIDRIDNTDAILYKYPGKTIIKLNVGDNDLQAFKTFLQPGDKINISYTYTITEKKKTATGTIEVESLKMEELFNGIEIGDMINDAGKSILDLYENYNMQSTYVQTQLDNSETWQQSIVAKSILLALTPEQLESYIAATEKNNVEFRLTLPQRD